MNVLFISYIFPYPPTGGEKERAYHIIKYLSQRNRVFLYSLCDDKNDLKYKEELEQYCASINIYYIHPALSIIRSIICFFSSYPFVFAYFFSYCMNREIKKTIKNILIDAIFAYGLTSAQYVSGKETMIKCVDLAPVNYNRITRLIEKLFPQSLLGALEARKIKKWEEKTDKAFDVLIVSSEIEKAKTISISPSSTDKIKVLANGVDFNYFMQNKSKKHTKTILFASQINFFPDEDAMIYFHNNVLPLIIKQMPSILFYIIGEKLPSYVKNICKKAIIIEKNGEEIINYLTKATVYIAPMRVHGEQQNNILRAMAVGVPVVATRKALQGLNVVKDKEIMIEDTPEEFARCILMLLRDEEKRIYIASNARRYVEYFHNWENNLMVINDIFQKTRSNAGQ